MVRKKRSTPVTTRKISSIFMDRESRPIILATPGQQKSSWLYVPIWEIFYFSTTMAPSRNTSETVLVVTRLIVSTLTLEELSSQLDLTRHYLTVLMSSTPVSGLTRLTLLVMMSLSPLSMLLLAKRSVSSLLTTTAWSLATSPLWPWDRPRTNYSS